MNGGYHVKRKTLPELPQRYDHSEPLPGLVILSGWISVGRLCSYPNHPPPLFSTPVLPLPSSIFPLSYLQQQASSTSVRLSPSSTWLPLPCFSSNHLLSCRQVASTEWSPTPPPQVSLCTRGQQASWVCRLGEGERSPQQLDQTGAVYCEGSPLQPNTQVEVGCRNTCYSRDPSSADREPRTRPRGGRR